MRKLSDFETRAETNYRKQQEELNEELINLGNRIEENKEAIEQTNTRIDEIENSDTCTKQYAQHEQADIGNLYVKENAQIDNDLIVNNKITTNQLETESIETNDIKSNEIKTTNIESNEIKADSLDTSKVNTIDITAQTIETNDIKSETGTFNKLDINTATIENFEIIHSDIKSLNVEEEIKAGLIESPKAKLTDIAVEILRSDVAKLEQLQTHNINYDNDPDNPYYVHIEPQDSPSETDYRIIEVPYCDTGDYYLSLRDPKTDISWWSVIIHNNASNITVSYSRRTTDLKGEPMVNPTLSQFYVYDFEGNAPQLYIKTYVGGNLYWQNQSLRKCPEVVMWDEYPFDISAFGALKYDVLHKAATWYTNHIDLRNGQSVGQASLFIIPSDWQNASRIQLEYDTSRDIPYKHYIPDQSLDSTDEVSFAELIIEPLEGRWVYSVESALKGRDPVLIKDGNYGTQEYDSNGTPKPVIGDEEAGQLNEYPWVIETQELAKWNGKTGVRVNTDVDITGTIYRDQAWLKESEYLYSKVNIDDYDVTFYKPEEDENGDSTNPTTVNNVLVYRRKLDTERGKKYDLVVSTPYVKSIYEDDDQIVWDCYTYTFYGEYPSGKMYTKVIEREENGETIHRILESTVDSWEYIIHVVQFKEPFSFGTVVLRSYSFEDYKKDIQYLGEVVEGKWNAGDIHIMRKNVDPKSSDYTGTDYDYDGSLIVDGESKFRDSILIQNDYDNTDVKPIENYEEHIDNKTSVITTEINETIGTEDDPATIDKTIYAETNISNTGNTIIENEGDLNLTNTGDSTIENTGNVEITHDGELTLDLTGDKEITSSGDIKINNESDTIEIENSGNTEITNNGDIKITNESETIEIDNTGEITIDQKGTIDFTTDSKTTFNGPSIEPAHDGADFELEINENTSIGTYDDQRDLRVTGRLLVNELELDVPDNQILYMQENKMRTVANSFIGDLNDLPTGLSNGSLVVEVE